MLVGVPSVFIRASGCNLRCTWCDTPYTSWTPEGREMLFGEILGDVRKRWASHVVVTGGEPMLQPLAELTHDLKEMGMHITIETAGTVFQTLTCDLMSISPKLANSTPHRREGGKWAAKHDSLRYQPDVLRGLMSAYPYQLKFVISEPQDIDEVLKVVAETGATSDRVVLMPEGTTAEAIYDRAQWLVEFCKRERFRYGPRLHIDIWGDTRGV